MCRRTECWKFGNHDRRTGGGPRAGNTARAAALVISALLAAPVVGASQQAARSKPQETFRVTTRLVEVSVVAETKDGEPARGLKAEDFKLYDNGEPQKIVFFSRETPPRRRLPGPLPPNVYTNRFEQLGEDVAGVTVILFDGLNTPLVDQVYARQQILKFLRQLRPGDRVALYVMGRGPRVIKDVSGDAGALAAALEHYKPEQRPSLDAPLYDPSLTPVAHFNAWLGELTFHLTDYFDRDRAFRTVRALTAIARHLERLPGRKNLLWVSGSFPISVAGSSIPLPERLKRSASTGKWPETDRLMRALSRANLAIYPVDARGLIAPRNYRADSRTVTADDHLKDAQIFSVMRKLAARTGGRAFYQNNDLVQAFRRATDDVRATYTLGYYPSHDEWNGRFREIRVEVARPEVKLLHRSGYFAQPDEPREHWYREEVLKAAMFSPLEASEVGLTVQVTPEKGVMVLDLGVDAGDITFEPAEGQWKASLDLWMVQLDAKERHLETDAQTTNLTLSPLDYQRVRRAGGLRLMGRVKPKKKALLVKVMVRDVASGALGSVIIPVEPYRSGLKKR